MTESKKSYATLLKEKSESFKKDPNSAVVFLKEVGIITKTGRIAKAYK